MSIPPFSIFSALSDLPVTAGVLFVVRRNWTLHRFPGALRMAVALPEALVNLPYMATARPRSRRAPRSWRRR